MVRGRGSQHSQVDRSPSSRRYSVARGLVFLVSVFCSLTTVEDMGNGSNSVENLEILTLPPLCGLPPFFLCVVVVSTWGAG